MAKGYFIRKGDKTTCGGEVLDADTRVMMFGFAHARAGDPVSCGKNDESRVASRSLAVTGAWWRARWTAAAAVPARLGSSPRLPPPPMSPDRVLRHQPREVPLNRRPRQWPPATR